MVNAYRTNWSRSLDDALWSYRTAYKTPIVEQRLKWLYELDEFHLEAYESSAIYKGKMKKYHDQKIKKREFAVGDLVLLFNSRLRLFLGKLKSKWTGPFLIIEVFPHGAVELEN
ncbi:uncharacterized protein LOC107024942 [Solanum pennellii]|uniref:Uncharacterized protein LOC107024942 n=1 Tax=Solanum pennellii TaxID=28526 RepID=A0ABM1H776_SOLPN|nr:uncharacterized protein LOC107024942 [Solanum pennellii]